MTLLTSPRMSPRRAPPPALPYDELRQVLEDLYCRQRRLEPTNHYLIERGSPRAIASHVRTFLWYVPHLPESGAVLDWGCHHAPDSCLLRAVFGDRFELHGCDIIDPSRYAVFHDYARPIYAQLLPEPAPLPYKKNLFAAVIASGTLEHVPMDYEALKDLYRVLRPNGVLVITYLPNRLSCKEWYRRVICRRDFHERLYGLREIRQLLKRTGLCPIADRYQAFHWHRCFEALGMNQPPERVVGVLSWLVPLQVVSGCLSIVARKMPWM